MADETMTTIEATLPDAQLENLEQFQREHGISSRDAALRLLLDIAFEAVSGTGRRYWDKSAISATSGVPESVPESDSVEHSDAAVARARALAERLRAEGHGLQADRLHEATASERLGDAVLEAVREACQTVLTMVEAIDPKTQLLAEELRLEVDKRLLP